MKLKFDVSRGEYAIIADILQQHLTFPCKVWVFGSRAKNQAKFNSDLDLAIEASNKIDSEIIQQIKQAFEDSRLAYKVDLLDIHAIEPYFQEIIEQQKVIFPLQNTSKIPKLRFGEFSGAWEEKKLGEVFNFLRGSPLLKSDIIDNGKYPCIHYGELFTTYNEKIYTIKSYTNLEEGQFSQYGDILMPSSDVTPQGLATVSALLKNNVILGSDTNILRPKKKIDSVFISYFLNKNKKKIIKLVAGTTIKHIYNKDIALLTLNLPSLSEQQKIATFFTSLDTKIEQITKKVQLLKQYKQGLMQKIFSQEIRFKADDGNEYPAWEEKKLGDISYITTGSSNREDSTLVGEYAFFDRSEDIRTSSRYLFDSEALIVPGEGQDFVPKHFHGKFDLHQRAYAIMEFKSSIGKFLFYYMGYYRHYFLSQAVGSTVKSLRLPMFQKMPIKLPSELEQQKIASFLTLIDKKIEKINQQLTHNQQFKQALLQQMGSVTYYGSCIL